MVSRRLLPKWSQLAATLKGRGKRNFTDFGRKALVDLKSKRSYNYFDKVLVPDKKLLYLGFLRFMLKEQSKQASRPMLVRGLRQDLTKYFLSLNVKVSVAQLVE